MRAGVAERVITPPGSWPMDGYILREGPSCGVLDDLLAQVLYLDDGHQQAVLVTLDLVGVDAAFTARLREAIEERYEVPGRYVLVAASHTHSGPGGFVSLWDPGAVGSPLRSYVIQRVLEAVGEARQAAAAGVATGAAGPAGGRASSPDAAGEESLAHGEASLAAGAATPANGVASRVAAATRWQVCRTTVDGVGADRNDPGGRPESDAGLLLLWRDDGSLAAVVVHYACHPTVLGPGNRLLATDFVGPLRRVLAGALADAGYGTPAVLFVNGAAADVSARFTRRDQTPAEARRLGALLAAQVLRAVLAARPEDAAVAGPIRALECELELPGRGSGVDAGPEAGGDAAALEGAIAEVHAELEQAARAGGDPHRVRALRARLEGLMARRAWLAPVPVVRLRLQAVAAGDVAWIAIPGELDRELGEAVRAASPFLHTFIAGYANDYAGYILGSRLAAAGTYESLASRLAPGGGEAVRDAAVQLLRRLRG